MRLPWSKCLEWSLLVLNRDNSCNSGSGVFTALHFQIYLTMGLSQSLEMNTGAGAGIAKPPWHGEAWAVS